MKEKEKNSNSESVLKEALLEYEEVIKAAKNKLAENNSKELDSLIAKFLKESENKNEPFNKAGKESTSVDKVQESTMIQKPIGEVVKEGVVSPEAINMKEASLSEVEAAFDSAKPDDDFQVMRSDDQKQLPSDGSNNFDLTSIESEIDEMMQEVNNAEQMQQQQAQQTTAAPSPVAATSTVAANSNPNDPMAKMKEMYEGMGKFLKEMEEMSTNQAMMNEFHSKMSEMYGESYKQGMDEAKLGELFSMYKKVKGGNAGEPVNKVDEVQEAATAPAAPAVEESHGIALSHNKLVGQEVQPRIENGKEYAANKIRVGLQNEATQKKMSGILKENLNLTKQLNKTKGELSESKTKVANIEAIKKLNENYKLALDKYRVQLKEMAVLNTNISYVNNLLVNEGLALSMKDKEEIIEKFKKVGNILESETTYKKLLNDFSASKKSIKESIEEKVNSTIVENSSANKLEESVGSGNEHIDKILRYSGVTEKRQIV